MGTNYYHHEEVCDHCGHAKSVTHIGKSSVGWTFIFHGTNEIRSYQDWLTRLRAGGRIVDEYGRVVPLDEFEKLVAAKKDGSNHAINYPSGSWLDQEGHGFSGGEFS